MRISFNTGSVSFQIRQCLIFLRFINFISVNLTDEQGAKDKNNIAVNSKITELVKTTAGNEVSSDVNITNASKKGSSSETNLFRRKLQSEGNSLNKQDIINKIICFSVRSLKNIPLFRIIGKKIHEQILILVMFT